LISESFKDENLINDMLTEIQSKYKLTKFPYHMECIDISHFSGSRASGGLSGFL
jgi:excinuclease UvrABC nuclease subunit